MRFFDISSGKMLQEKKIKDKDDYNIMCYDQTNGFIYGFRKNGVFGYFTFKI